MELILPKDVRAYLERLDWKSRPKEKMGDIK